MLQDFVYSQASNGVYVKTNWKRTNNGVSSYDLVVPNFPEVGVQLANLSTVLSSAEKLVIPYQVHLNGPPNFFVGRFRNSRAIRSADIYHPNITIMAGTFYNCKNLVNGSRVGPNVQVMDEMYWGCLNLTGPIVSGENVTSMLATYCQCRSLVGSPVCGPNVTTLQSTYLNCSNLTGSPVCGPNVTTMAGTYAGCVNLTGSPVCGNKVTSLQQAYQNCRNLTGLPVCGPRVTSIAHAYANCPNLSAGTSYFYSPNIATVAGCFFGKNNSRRYNIHVPADSKTLNTIYSITTPLSIVGANITWTNNGVNFYNTAYNIYIYANSSM
jgi:hypothetical protein